MDIVPTVLEAAGVDKSQFEMNGVSLLEHLTANTTLDERPIFWELGSQTAVRRGMWKLVLNGQLVEHEEPIADVHLANLDDDPSESVNLAEAEPAITAGLKRLAEDWRDGIERRWSREYASAESEQGGYRMA
jgi:arylsulfatase A-like enzyme